MKTPPRRYPPYASRGEVAATVITIHGAPETESGRQGLLPPPRAPPSAVRNFKLIVDDSPWVPERRFSDPDRLVGLRIGWEEKAHQARLRAVHARWDPAGKLWWIPSHLVTQLGVEERLAA